MQKLFALLGGRRFAALGLSTLAAFIANAAFDPEAAQRVTDTVLYAAGAFILGESGADAVGRYKKG